MKDQPWLQYRKLTDANEASQLDNALFKEFVYNGKEFIPPYGKGTTCYLTPQFCHDLKTGSHVVLVTVDECFEKSTDAFVQKVYQSASLTEAEYNTYFQIGL